MIEEPGINAMHRCYNTNRITTLGAKLLPSHFHRLLGKKGTLLAPALGIVLFSSMSHASPYSEVASAFDSDDRFDLHASLDYQFSTRSSVIKREFVGLAGTSPNDPVPLVRDLVFSSSSHLLVPKIELGLFHDFWFSASLPIVLNSNRSLAFDQRSKPCTFPGASSTPSCINAENSSTVLDGLLPATGFDANDPTGPGFSNTDTIFRGPTRRGTTQLNLGLGFAPMNQRRDSTKPTWKIGGEIRLPIGKTKKLNRVNPDNSTGVSEGVTHIRLWTSMARKLGWAEPHVEFWWQAPLSVNKDAPLAPLDQPFGVTSEGPQQQAGTKFGVEATLWEDPKENLRVGIDFSTTLTSYFEGRGYSDMWEVFQYAGDATVANAPLVLDLEPTITGIQKKSHPGATNIENFMTVDTNMAVTAHLGDRVRFSAGMGLKYEQSHLITFADAGTDLPRCGGSVVVACETGDNQVVNPNTVEVNPLHSGLIDTAGHRFRVADGKEVLFTVDARILF